MLAAEWNLPGMSTARGRGARALPVLCWELVGDCLWIKRTRKEWALTTRSDNKEKPSPLLYLLFPKAFWNHSLQIEATHIGESNQSPLSEEDEYHSRHLDLNGCATETSGRRVRQNWKHSLKTHHLLHNSHGKSTREQVNISCLPHPVLPLCSFSRSNLASLSAPERCHLEQHL